MWHVTKTKISRLGNKKTERSCGAWGYRVAVRSGLSLGPIYLTPTTTHRKQEMTSKFLSLSFSLPLTRLRVPATSNTSPRPTRWPVMPRQFVRNLTMPTFLLGQWDILARYSTKQLKISYRWKCSLHSNRYVLLLTFEYV